MGIGGYGAKMAPYGEQIRESDGYGLKTLHHMAEMSDNMGIGWTWGLEKTAPYAVCNWQGQLLIVNKDGRFSKRDEENTQFRAKQSKQGNPSGHNDQLGVVKDIPIGVYSGIGFYAGRGGLVVGSRPRDQRIAGSKPDSTEDPSCMAPAAG
ncbi:hypothetical protein AVEN_65436-1 [Araneus ventricosus]|uniref:Uncharacterized protein n=1 Tax=Araneus ventricosus TaxID=182803 RepID=A0A4Y2PKZ8_ARAVE|nr:hypothetical protein AVEN_65436-1 [Araneus ventricosus]